VILFYFCCSFFLFPVMTCISFQSHGCSDYPIWVGLCEFDVAQYFQH